MSRHCNCNQRSQSCVCRTPRFKVVPLVPPAPPTTNLVLSTDVTTPGGVIAIYTFTLTNNGPLDAQNVVLTVTFAGSLSSFSGGSVSGNVATLNIGTFASGLSDVVGTMIFVPAASSVVSTVTSTTPVSPANSLVNFNSA